MTSRTWDNLWKSYSEVRVKGLKTEDEVCRIYTKYIQSKFGKKLVSKTTYEQLEKNHQALADCPYQANRILALFKTMFKHAQALRWMPPGHNPAVHVKMYPERKRRRHMKAVEAPRIASAIRGRERSAPYPCLFLWLVIFTGARSGEIKSARWGDLDGNMLRLKNHKTDKSSGVSREIILPPSALAKIEQLVPAGTTRNPGQKIIPLAYPEHLWRWLRVEAKCPDLRVHDLRHTFGSYALSQGFTLDQIGEALNHANPATTKIYTELMTGTRKKMAGEISLAILKDMDVVNEDDIDPLS